MSASALAAALQKSIGENAEAEVFKYLSTGYAPLNWAMTGDYAGGLPYGKVLEVYGPSSSGKTALATKFMVEAQRAGGVAIFQDFERSFNLDMAQKLGMNTAFPFFVYKRPRTWEQANTEAMKAAEAIRKSKAIPEEAPIVFVLDSVAAAVPKSVAEKGIEEYSMNDTTALARATSQTIKAVKMLAGDFNITCVYLNQIRTKPGVVYGDPTTTPGGQAMEFYADIRLAVSRKKVMEETEGGKEFVGQIITAKVQKSKFTHPFKECAWRLMFKPDGTPFFDVTTSLIDELIERKKLAAPGGRITWGEKSYFKKQLVELIEKEGKQDELVKLLGS